MYQINHSKLKNNIQVFSRKLLLRFIRHPTIPVKHPSNPPNLIPHSLHLNRQPLPEFRMLLALQNDIVILQRLKIRGDEFYLLVHNLHNRILKSSGQLSKGVFNTTAMRVEQRRRAKVVCYDVFAAAITART
jgi:hypothetical protein